MIHTPRYLRLHEIVIKNHIGEIDDIANYVDTVIKYVRVDENFGITQTEKGIQNDDVMQIIIDMNDYFAIQNNEKAVYIEEQKYNPEKGLFTLRADKDLIMYKGKNYTVNKIKKHMLFSEKIEYIEVTIK